MAVQSREEGGKVLRNSGLQGGNTSEKKLRQGSLGFENQQAQIPKAAAEVEHVT